MRTVLRVAMSVGVLVLIGCGGSSEGGVFTDTKGGNAGANANPSGGNAGANANPSGGNAGANANPSGGNATAGNTSGTNSGGSSGMGAVAGGTAGGSAGAGTVPPELIDRCGMLCASISSLQCDNAEPERDCLRQCRIAVQQPACVPVFQDLFDCTESATFACDAEGQASAPGCEAEFVLATQCVQASIPDPTLQVPCERYCTDARAAQCASSGTQAECQLDCQTLGGIVPVCSEHWRQYLSCSEGAMFYCNEDQEPVASDCEASVLRFAACVFDET